MSAGFLLSVPGKLSTVIANLATLMSNYTAARAAMIDTAISSRASAATALTNTTWTDARAASLDSIATAIGYLTALDAAPPLNAPTSFSPSYSAGDLSLLASGNSLGVNVSTASFSTSGYKAVINIAAKGVISFLAAKILSQTGITTGGTYGARLTLDGAVVFNVTSAVAYVGVSVVNQGLISVGGFNVTTGDMVFESIPFYSSFLFEVYCNQAAGSMASFARYRTTP